MDAELEAVMSPQARDARRFYLIYRVRATVIEMLAARGFTVTTLADRPAECDFEAFSSQFCQGGVVRFQELAVKGHRTVPAADPSAAPVREQIYTAFVTGGAPVTEADVKTLATTMRENGATHGILIVNGTVRIGARREVQRLEGEGSVVEVFQHTQLAVNITKHKLVPRHILLSAAEKAALLQSLHITDRQLPRIKASDPVAAFFGAQRGDVFRIERPSESAGTADYYRVVV